MKKINLKYKMSNQLNESTILSINICDGQLISTMTDYNNNEYVESIEFLTVKDMYCLECIKRQKGALPEEVWQYKRGQQYFPIKGNQLTKIFTNQIAYHNLQLLIMLPYIYEMNKKPYIYSFESGTIIPSKIYPVDENDDYKSFKILFPDMARAVYKKSDLILETYQSRLMSIKRC